MRRSQHLKRQTPSSPFTPVVFLALLGIMSYGVYFGLEKVEAYRLWKDPEPETDQVQVLGTNQTASSSSAVESSVSSTPVPSPEVKLPPLGQVVANSLEGTKGSYAVAIKNLNTGEEYYLNEYKSFETGSLYKLWVMAESFHKIQSGELDPEEKMSRTIADLNQTFGIDPENAELTSGGITMTVNQALTQMITISHNYAAMLLTEKNKLSTVRQFLTENGFKDSAVGGDPKTTALDMLKFYEKLRSGQLANQENTDKMLELLKKQRLNNKLPASLPEGVTVAHKTGELGMFTHDAGIVYGKKGEYIIVVLSESPAPAAAEDRIADVSKAVYNYFESK